MPIQMTQAQKDAFVNNTPQEIQINVTPLTGSALTITNADIVQGSFSIDRSAVSGSNIEIGNVSSAELIMALNNSTGRFDSVALEGATLTVQIKTKDGIFFDFGKFAVDEITRNKTTINVVAFDAMVSLDTEVDRTIFSTLETPTSVITKILTAVGVTQTPVLDLVNGAVEIEPLLISEGATYRDLLIYVLEICGSNAFFLGDTFNAYWYNRGTATDTIDASNRVASDMQGYEVTITGVTVVDGETVYETGTKDYVIEILSNPLITSINVAQILTGLSGRLINFSYQPFSAEVLPMVWLLPMDKVDFEKDGTTYTTIITNSRLSLNRNYRIEAKGQSPLSKGYARKAMTKAQENDMKSLEQRIETEINEVRNYFWHDSEGAHVTTQPHTVGTDFNALISSSTVALRKGTNPYVQLDGTNQRVLIGSTENQRTVVTNDGMEVQGGSYTYGGTTSTFVPVKLWGTVQSSSGNEYKLLASQRHGASLIRSTYTYNVANSQISQVNTTEEIVTYTHASKSLLINKWSSSSAIDYRASVGTTGVFLTKGLNGVLSVDWNGKITSADHVPKFGNTTFNIGDNTVSHIAIWGNITNKVGMSAKNTSENKEYGLLARARELLLYNYTDGGNVWSLTTKPKLLTVTRIENPYVNATAVGRIYAYEQAGFLWCNGNVEVTTSMPTSSGEIEIAQISGWVAPTATYCNVAMQAGGGAILVWITTDGKIKIYNGSGQNVKGYGRASLCAPKYTA